MSVKNAKNYLLISNIDKLKVLFKKLYLEDVTYEVLNPKELGEEWQKVITQDRTNKENKENLTLLSEVLEYYKPKGVFSALEDNRVEADPKIVEMAFERKDEILKKAKEVLDKNRQVEDPKEIEDLDEETYRKFIALYTYYEIETGVNEDLSKSFKPTPESSDMSFVSVHQKDADFFESEVKKNEIDYNEANWTKEIVSWERQGGLESFRGIAEAVGTIDSKETDPTASIAFFYMLFFAFCLADAGYGLILAIFTGFFLFVKKPNPGAKNFLRLFFYTGLATFLFGLVTNSWFGDLFNSELAWEIIGYTEVTNSIGEVVKTTSISSFLSIFQVLDILDLEGKADALLNVVIKNAGVTSPVIFMLALSGVIGFLHGILGNIFKLNTHLKSQENASALDSFAWIYFLLSLVFVIVSSALSLVPGLISMGILASGFVAIFTLSEGKGIPGKIIGGLGKIYALISVFSDVMSYTRIVATGLAGTIIANVINLLALLMYQAGEGLGGPVVGILLAVPMLIGGHLFNLVVSTFGAYINPLRLHYVEFMPKFFLGRARKLKPTNTNLKYLKLN